MPELRRSVRLTLPDELQPAVLDLGRQAVLCRVLDQSSGGFGVALPSPAPLFVGMVAVLTTSTGSGRVKVVHLRPEGEDVRAGLERLAEIARPGQLSRPQGGRSGRATSWVTAASGSGLVVALLGLWLVWDFLGRPGWLAPGQAPTPEAAKNARRARHSLEGPPRADALLSDSVAHRLQLTAEQQVDIASIVMERDEAIQRLYRQATSRHSQAVAWQVAAARRDADEQAWGVLTSEQQRKYFGK